VLSLDNDGEGDSGLLMARGRKVRVEEARLRRVERVSLQVKGDPLQGLARYEVDD
jgi:hypothetical protein